VKFIVEPRKDDKQEFNHNDITHCCLCDESPRYCGPDPYL